jgi:23S rRNA (cytosine1962-C5)-methyltransferase
MQRVIIDSQAARRIRRGHPWVFSNQVKRVEGHPVAGDVVAVAEGEGAKERSHGTAFYNPHSLIALRHLSFEGEIPDRAMLGKRLRAARELRERLFPGSDSWRLCHGEADFLPGLFIDRHGPVFVVQAFSAGMDRLLPLVTEVLADDFGAACVIERNESHVRQLEGLEDRTGILAGSPPGPLVVDLGAIRMRVDPLAGQKTGSFLDQRENRVAAARHAKGRSVLEMHCNLGGFSILAALAGAERVAGVDASAEAVAAAAENARLNGVEDRCAFLRADASDDMDARHRRHERHGVVLVDPPSFTRSKKHVAPARRALRDLNRRAMTLVEPGGILVTSDCSHHIHEETFHEILRDAAEAAQRRLRILEVRSQSPDHPVLAEMPETRYLKCLIAQVL